ncbi:protector from prophage-induced early lysis [Proteus phage SJ_PmiM]|nr:protector from prophage-induced early lysis [Proteus phage SJ_PmiM]
MAVKILNEQQKESVVNLFAEGKSKSLIARHFGVSSDTITRVLKENPTQIYTPGPGSQLTYDWVFADKIIIDPKLNTSIACHTVCINNPKDRDMFTKSCDLSIPGVIRIGKLKSKSNIYAYNCSKEQKAEDIGNYIVNLPKKSTMNLDFAISKNPKKVVEKIKEDLESLVWNANSKFISITVGTKTYNAGKDHENFMDALSELSKAMEAVAKDDVKTERKHVQKALDLINTKRAIKSYTKGHIKIEGSTLYYKDLIIDSGLTRKIISNMKEGKDFEFLLPFLENLMLNPSRKAVMRLYDFLMATDIEITSDGHFIAWKVVRNNYLDCHSGTFDNSPGKRVEVPRNTVDEDDNRTCSSGLHVCSKSYIPAFGGSKSRVVSVKVHPRDVVSIPVDYNDAKMRTCGYTVLEDVTSKFKI